MNKVLLMLASMLAVSLLASPKLPSAKIRLDISRAFITKDVNYFAAVLAKHRLDANSVFMSGGYTVLHEAAAKGSPEIVEYLITQTQDVEVNVVNEYGYTPLDEAIAFGDADTVALLEAAGATHGEGFRIKTAPTAYGDGFSSDVADGDLHISSTTVYVSVPVDLLPEHDISLVALSEFYRQSPKAMLDEVQKDILDEGIWCRPTIMK